MEYGLMRQDAPQDCQTPRLMVMWAVIDLPIKPTRLSNPTGVMEVKFGPEGVGWLDQQLF